MCTSICVCGVCACVYSGVCICVCGVRDNVCVRARVHVCVCVHARARFCVCVRACRSVLV